MIICLIVSQEKQKQWPLVVAMGSARDPREVREGPREVREGVRSPRRSATQNKLPKTLTRLKISYQKP